MSEEIKKEKRIFKKIVIFLLMVFVVYLVYKNYQQNYIEISKDKIVDVNKSNESDIFELGQGQISVSPEARDGLDESHLTNLTVEKLKRSGAEFIYQLLLYNQDQISQIKSESENLKQEFIKYKSREKISKMILVYVRLRDRIYQGKNYQNLLRSFELLSVDDAILREKVIEFKQSISSFEDYRSLEKDFSKYIPSLIALKDNERSGGLINRIRFKLAKIITLRSLDENNVNVDGAIVRIRKSLRNSDCNEAIFEINSLEEKYRKDLEKFYKKLNGTCVFEKNDEEIMLHLEGLI